MTCDDTSVQSFKQKGALIVDTSEILSRSYAAEIGKLELPSTFFIKGVHWTTHLEEAHISMQSEMKDFKF